MTNREYLAGPSFRVACRKFCSVAKIPEDKCPKVATKRQVSKFRNKKGRVYKTVTGK